MLLDSAHVRHNLRAWCLAAEKRGGTLTTADFSFLPTPPQKGSV
jgi:hypothetical protein